MSSDEGDDDTAAAMAAAMGFSSFGAQDRPSKKRRFNPRADAATGIGSTPIIPARAPGTAANSTTLGTRPPSNLPLHPPHNNVNNSEKKTSHVNSDEIGLSDSDSDDPPPQYIDTSREIGQNADPDTPPTAEEEAARQADIDAIVQAGNAAYNATTFVSQMDGHASSRSRGLRPSVVVQAPAAGQGSISGVGGSRLHADASRGIEGRRERESFRNHGDAVEDGEEAAPFFGVEGKREDWWVTYYDPKFNENPWEALEKKMGLEPQGPWLSRAQRTA